MACPTDTDSKVELVLELNSPGSQFGALSTTLMLPKCGVFTIDDIEDFKWYMDKHFCV